MKKIIIFTTLLSICSFGEESISLRGAFESAIKNTEISKIQDERLFQTKEKVTQAKSLILPKISFNANYLIQDNLNAGDLISNKSFIRNPYVYKLTALQPLYHGLREFIALDASELDVTAQDASLKITNLNTYQSVSQSFYNILSLKKDLENLINILAISNKRIVELKSRTKIGRSRKGDLLSAESQVALYMAQIDLLITQIEQAKENFYLLTGIKPTNNEYTFYDSLEIPEKLQALNIYLDKIEERPDIINAKYQNLSSEKNIDIAKTGHHPSLDFIGNYYLGRNGSLQNSKWDLGFSLSFPIFNGFSTDSSIKEAISKSKEKELALIQTRKIAEKEIRSAYKTLVGNVSQLKALKDALNISEQNYKEQLKDYGFGLATNLEVLQALNIFYDNKRNFDKTLYQSKLALVQLDIAIGRLP